jgi:alcohol dehydrogenase
MNAFYKVYARCYQQIMRLALYALNFGEPKLIEGNDAILKVPSLIKETKHNGVLIVTDEMIYKLGLTDSLQDELRKENVPFDVYHGVVPNPTIKNVEEALKIYKEKGLDCVCAVGGGSSIDCAKMVAARSTNPKKPVAKMKGVLKVSHKPDLIIAVPTTAGTGSETTVAAVILDSETHDKYACNDPKLIPRYAVLEPKLLIGLPGKVTSTTGIDALCHAVEAYIGSENTKKTKLYAEEAVKGIFENLLPSYNNPTDLTLRANMQKAAYQAGVAFTRAYVGYIHSMSHALGALYNTPHGLAISIVMPYVLEAYGKKVWKRLAKLADIIGVSKEGMTLEEKSNAFIEAIKRLEADMQIPNTIKGIVDTKDFDVLAEHAVKEANPLYPVPVIFNKKEIIELYKRMYI